MRRVLRLVGLAAAAFALGCADARQDFVSAEGEFRVSFPGAPVARKNAAQDEEGRPMQVIEAVLERQNPFVKYSAKCEMPDQPLSESALDTILRRTKEEGLGYQTVRVKDVTAGGIAGQEIVKENADHGAIRLRVFLTPAKRYWLSVDSTQRDQVFTKDADQFLDSLRIAKGP